MYEALVLTEALEVNNKLSKPNQYKKTAAIGDRPL